MKKILFLFIISIFFLNVFSAVASEEEGTIDVDSYTSKIYTHGQLIYWLVPGNAGAEDVLITDDAVTGDIWGPSLGWIHLDPNSGGVLNDPDTDSSRGQLSGYAWGEAAGWINFGPFSNSSTQEVYIDMDGEFVGFAWSENYGWIQFDCGVADACVKTDWRPKDARDGDTTGGGGGGNPPSLCSDTNAANYGGALPCTYTISICSDVAATNFGGPSPCDYAPVGCVGEDCNPPEEENICEDLFATNYGSPSPCDYAPIGCVGEECNPPETCVGADCVPPPTDPEICVGIDCITDGGIDFTDGIPGGIEDYINSESGGLATKIFTGFALTTSAVISIASLLFMNPLSLSELVFIPFRLWSLLLAAFGLSKRRPPWGTVYDSITKQPLDPAYVVLYDKYGTEVSTSITDLDGRFGFLVPSGTYKIVANKTNYKFPSEKLAGQKKDELYQDLYFGEDLEVTENSPITKNIPMDPINFDWNEFAKKQQKLMKFYSRRDAIFRQISDTLFAAGFFIAFIAFLVSPVLYNIIIFALYILLFILREVGYKNHKLGGIVDKATGLPLSYAILRVYSVSNNQEITHKVSDARGHYYCLISNGNYYVTIEKKNADSTYTKVFVSLAFEVKDGHIRDVFSV